VQEPVHEFSEPLTADYAKWFCSVLCRLDGDGAEDDRNRQRSDVRRKVPTSINAITANAINALAE
jgi:hypothetical protein